MDRLLDRLLSIKKISAYLGVRYDKVCRWIEFHNMSNHKMVVCSNLESQRLMLG